MLAFAFIDNNRSLYISYGKKCLKICNIYLNNRHCSNFYSLHFCTYNVINILVQTNDGGSDFRNVRKTAKSEYYLRHVCPSVRMKNSALSERIFIKHNIWIFFENLSRKFKFNENLTRRFLTKVVEKINTRFLFKNSFSENRAVYEIMWKNIIEWGRPQMATWGMRFTCWMTKAIDTHSEYVILLPFPRQQWLVQHASMLRHKQINSLVIRIQWTVRKDKLIHRSLKSFAQTKLSPFVKNSFRSKGLHSWWIQSKNSQALE